MNFKPFTFLLIFVVFGLTTAFAQVGGTENPTTDGRQGNAITTAVPFLLITPDARSGALGDVGVATTPDVNATHWNPAKLAFMKDQYGFGLSYSPWLQKLVPDINLAYINGYYRIDDRNVIGGSLRYFSLGEIQLVDANQTQLGNYSPNELAVDGTFARSFGENFSLGTALRFIYSNLSSGQFFDGQQTKPGTAVAADVSAYYKDDKQIFNTNTTLAFGLDISNIGTKMSYADGGQKYFLPTNMRLGGASTFHLDDFNDFTFALDLNKLLVPTPPIYDANGRIVSGKDPNRSVPAGIFGSFSDAPGGASEEVQEVSISTGLEYWYNRQFAVRAGYFYENPNKGNRQYLTLGLGLKYNIVDIDFSYLIANQQKSPLANTLRFSLIFNFGDTGANAN
ncbi:type IX secretion system outer membrane channel protein PorV [Pedobacter cryophilus]|uniref:Type IX secretion system outer membrane channel protein PorV n=1 Tax=Pedobacter cryophilus TaxID=2571271 RepID=A0A4U1C5D1_9SPHI|nr:type IX secretion system outer membrane channel protein PorV [Pedobacter cryophilus]TKC00485.1 type IX secretion system outer membrane channel protein PorV [Pedobacter cryophilus]